MSNIKNVHSEIHECVNSVWNKEELPEGWKEFVIVYTVFIVRVIKLITVRGGADKSLVRPGRKQAAATKLRIYSTYSSRSSIHFLAHCSNFCKPLKKKFRQLSVQPCLRDSSDLRVEQKMVTFQLFFQSREQVVV